MPFRTRPLVALVVLTAWLGTLVVTTATSSSAQLEPNATPTLSGPSAGQSLTPTFTIGNVTAGDDVECAVTTGAATPSWSTCTDAVGDPSTSTYVPTLTVDDTYKIWARSKRIVDVATTTPSPTTTDVATPDPSSDPDTPVASITPSPTVAPSPTTTPAPDYSTTAMVTYVLRQSGPAVTKLTGPSTAAGSGAVQWQYDAESFEVKCTLTGPTGFTTLVAPCGATDADFPGAALTIDGDYSIVATAYDGATPTTSTAPETYTVDTTAPTVSISGSSGSGTSNTVHWTVTLSEPGTTSCDLKNGGGISLGVGNDCAQYATFTLPTDEDTYTLTATGVDNVGLPTATAATRSYTYDVAPGAATVTGPTSPGNATTVSWTVTTQTTAGTTVHCELTGPDGFDRVVVCNPGTTNLSTSLQNDVTNLIVDQIYTLTATVTDGGGTSTAATATYDLDHTAPTVAITPDANNSTTPGAGWTVNVTDGNTPTCDLKNGAGTSLGLGTDCATYTSVTLPAKDTYTFSATSSDDVGNSSTSTDTWIYRDAPTASVSPSSPTGNIRAVSWTVAATTGTNLTCVLTDPDGTPHSYGCFAGSAVPTNVSTSEGTSTFSVVATDPETGFTGTASATYRYDVTPPPAFTVNDDMTDTDGDRNTRSTNWSWTDNGYPSTCRLLLGGANYGSAGSCNSPYNTDVPSDGAWQLRVTLTDAAGNTRTATSAVVRVDTVAPAQPGITTPKSLSNDVAPVWTLTGEGTATFACSWTSGLGGTVPASGPCVSGYAPTLPSIDDTYTLHVVQTDVAGNASLERTFDYTLDLTPPVTTFSVEPTPNPGNDPSVSWTTTVSETSAKTECRLIKHTSGPDLVVYDWRTVSCGRTVAATLGNGDGSYVMQVRDTDPAGNVATAGTPSTPFDLDTTGPGAPGVDGPSSWSSEPDVTWTITDPTGETPAAYYCRLVRNNTPGGWVRCDSKTFSTTLPNEATYRLDVESADALGNRSATAASADYLFDPNPPAAATFAGTDGTGHVTSHAWNWTNSELNLTSDCRLYTVDGGTRVLVNTTLGCTSPQTETLAASTPGTTYVLEVTLVDRAGNSTAKDGPSYLLDTVAPIAPTVDGPSGTDSTRAATYTFVPSEPGTTATCQLMQRPTNSTTWTAVQTSSPCTSPWVITLPNVDGDYTTQVVTRDAAGNDSLYGESQTYTLDVTGPTSPTFLTGPTGTANSKSVTWTWTHETASTGECTLKHGTTVLVNAIACDTGTFSTTLNDGDGTYTLTVRLTDQYHNIGGTTTSVTYTLDATPPGAPDVSGPTTTSNNTTANYAITSVIEAGATAECRLERGGTVVADWASCTMPTSRVLSGDGHYVFKVRLIDQYGNVGLPGASPDYLLDTTPPTRPAVTAPNSPSHDLAPVFSFTIDSDTTASCSLARGGTVVATAPSCAGSFTGALSGLSDGDYVLTVISKDAAGNTTSGTSPAYTLDTTPPPAPVVGGQSGPSQTRSPSFSWTSETGARSECATQLKDQVLGAWTSCTSPYSPSLPKDGTWTLSVRLIDTADNVSAVGTSGPYVLDTTAPNAPAVASPASPGRDLAPSWSADVEPGSKTECRFSGPGHSETAFTPCTLPMSTPIGGDGTYVLEVRAIDTAGNISPVGTGTYVLDTTPPPAPVVSQPTGPGRSRSPLISYTAEAGTTGSCRVTRGATVVVETSACSSPVQLNLGDLPDGAYTLTVRAVDAAGNTGPAATGTYVLDTTPPAVPTMTLIAGSPSSDRSPQYAFSVEPGASPNCRLTSPGGVRDLPCTTSVILGLTDASEGDYTLAITARDSAGNTSAPATSTYTLDNSAPAAPRITGPNTPDKIRNPSWRISATGSVQCRLLRGTATFKDWAPCGSTYTADLYGQLDAIYLLEARIVGTTAQTTSRYRLDTTGPGTGSVVITGPPSPSTVRKPVWSIASSDVGATAQCRVAVFGALLMDWSDCPVSAAGSLFSYDLTDRGDGVYTLSVRLVDSAGNASAGAVATSDYELDTSAPAAVGVIAPKSPDSNKFPTWTLNSTSGAKLECRVTNGPKVIKDFSLCPPGTFSFDLSGLPDGTYTLTVHALSAAGTPGADTASSYVFDRTPSDAPTGLMTAQRSPSSFRTPKWTFTLPEGSVGARCTVSLGSVVISDDPCTSPFTMDLTTAKDGAYALKVVAIDAAGNASSPVTQGYVLRTAPAPDPEFVQRPGSPSSTTEPTWTFSTAYDVKTECRVLYNGALQDDGAWTKCEDRKTIYLSGTTPQPDGRYTLQVRGVDVAGNLSRVIEDNYDFDRNAAPLAVFLSSPDSPDNDTSPIWTLSGPPAQVTGTSPGLLRANAVSGSSLECQLATPGRGPGGWVGCSGTYTTNTVGDGSYVLGIRTADAGAGPGPTSTSTYRLVTKKPASLVFTETPPAAGNDETASWQWEDDPLVRVQCRFGRTGALPAALTPCLPPPFSPNVSKSGQGSYTFETKVVDRAGNLSDSTLGSYRYDTTPPPAPSFSARPPARGTSGSVTWTFPLTGDAATAVCVVTHDGKVSEFACNNGSYTLSGLSNPGTWQLSVHFVDAAGNSGPSVPGSYTLTAFVRDRSNGSGSGSGNGGGGFVPAPPDGGDNGFTVAPPVGHDPFLGPHVPRKSNVPGAIANTVKAIGKNVAGHVFPRRVGIPEGTGVPDAIKNVIGSTITKPQLPLALFVIVVLFLLVQNRIDRRDPKLAAAPVEAEPELEFGPRVRFLSTGGATA